ncbi:hypothetical protein [Streptomyces sp. NPDC050534]|uniref:hypothetical protein n=1 Tax=Streptomyces sp. NPDC050534 TaxID=3365625 RepID=UPI0037ABDCE8
MRADPAYIVRHPEFRLPCNCRFPSGSCTDPLQVSVRTVALAAFLRLDPHRPALTGTTTVN